MIVFMLPFRLKNTTTIGWKIRTFPKRKLVLASVNQKGITVAWKLNQSFQRVETGKQRDKIKYNNDIIYNRSSFSGCWQRKIEFMKSFSFSSQSFAPLVLFLLYQCPSILLVSGVGAAGEGGLGKGCGSQGELAVTQFFVHLPPEPRHILLAKAEWLP